MNISGEASCPPGEFAPRNTSWLFRGLKGRALTFSSPLPCPREHQKKADSPEFTAFQLDHLGRKDESPPPVIPIQPWFLWAIFSTEPTWVTNNMSRLVLGLYSLWGKLVPSLAEDWGRLPALVPFCRCCLQRSLPTPFSRPLLCSPAPSPSCLPPGAPDASHYANSKQAAPSMPFPEMLFMPFYYFSFWKRGAEAERGRRRRFAVLESTVGHFISSNVFNRWGFGRPSAA